MRVTDQSVLNPDRHFGCRINDRVIWKGFRAMIIQNDKIQIVLLPDKGTEIIQFLYKPTDTDFLWHWKNPLRDPENFIPVSGGDPAPFFDHWSGGWFEVLPNNGPPSEYKGHKLGFYAETINLPWEYQIIEDTPERVKIFFWVRTYRTPFLIKKYLTIESGNPSILIEEEVINTSGEEMAFAWGHHPVVGPPFLDEACRIFCPDCKVIVLDAEDGPGYRMKLHQEGRWPFIKDNNGNKLDLRQVLPKEAHNMDNCYLTDYGKDAFIAVSNSKQNVGFGLSWDSQVFKYVWLWQAFGGGEGYPWFNDSYQMGIEPWSSFPCAGLQAAIENETALNLGPKESVKTWLTAVAYESEKDVEAITKEGKVIYKK